MILLRGDLETNERNNHLSEYIKIKKKVKIVKDCR